MDMGANGVPFWHYHLLLGEAYLNREVRRNLLSQLDQWHAIIHPGCKKRAKDYKQCKALQLIVHGMVLAKVHPELLNGVTLALDAEHVVRQEGYAEAETQRQRNRP